MAGDRVADDDHEDDEAERPEIKLSPEELKARERTIALWKKCQKAKRAKMDRLRKEQPELSETQIIYEAQKEAARVWNDWADGLIASRKTLAETGEWEADLGWREEGLNDETTIWLFKARAVFSGVYFIPAGQIPEKRSGRQADPSVISIPFEGSGIDFTGFLFPGAILFENATFLADASFRGVTFGAANFAGATFRAYAYFKSAIFRSVSNFTRATFKSVANFAKATFGSVANFTRATFRASAFFMSATFRAGANFTNATFRASAFFGDATFRVEANFTNATFRANAYFGDATFRANAYFPYATFRAYASFRNTTFRASPYFTGATFRTDASFESTTFRADTNFRNATFRAEADFRSATFRTYAFFFRLSVEEEGFLSFAGTEFRGPVNFRLADLKGPLQFQVGKNRKGVDFRSTADFRHLHSTRSLWFQNVRFEHVPDFREHQISHRPELGDIRIESPFQIGAPKEESPEGWNDPRPEHAPGFLRRISLFDPKRFEYAPDSEAAEKFKALRGLAVLANDHDKERDYFASELKALRFRAHHPYGQNWVLFWLGLVYESLSDFGRSVWRPVMLWFGSVVLFWFAFLALHSVPESPPPVTMTEPPLSVHTSVPIERANKETDWRDRLSAFFGAGRRWIAAYNRCADGAEANGAITSALGLSFRNGLVFMGAAGGIKAEQNYTCLYGGMDRMTGRIVRPDERRENRAALVPVVPPLVSVLSVLQVLWSAVLIFLFGLALRNHFRVK